MNYIGINVNCKTVKVEIPKSQISTLVGHDDSYPICKYDLVFSISLSPSFIDCLLCPISILLRVCLLCNCVLLDCI